MKYNCARAIHYSTCLCINLCLKFLVLNLLAILVSGQGKYRSWTGPSQFFFRNPPSPRNGHSFLSSNGNLYVFGGGTNAGKKNGFRNSSLIHLIDLHTLCSLYLIKILPLFRFRFFNPLYKYGMFPSVCYS
jgi:hypothetical protein